MPRKTVAVLYDVWWPDEASPEPDSEPPVEVHHEIHRALREIGYRPIYAVLDGESESLARLASTRASVFFNLTESYAGDDTKDLHIAAYLELLGRRYTGNGPRALHLGQDKVLAKKLLRFHGVPTPEFVTLRRGARIPRRRPRFPLIVKPAREDGSIGIDTGSVVRDVRRLREQVDYVHESFGGVALVERYIEGRDIYVGVVGNDPPEALPLVEVDFSRLPEGVPRIAGTEVKWWHDSEIYRLTPAVFPRGISKPLTKRLQQTAVDAYRALGLRDYGRVDVRLGADASIHVLEVNPNPWLASDSEFVMAWKKLGRSYGALVERLVGMALARGRP